MLAHAQRELDDLGSIELSGDAVRKRGRSAEGLDERFTRERCDRRLTRACLAPHGIADVAQINTDAVT
jgi:hypothetical protein